LSPLILTPSVLQTTIQDIQVILDKDYNGYKVLTSDPNYYYKYASFTILRNDSTLVQNNWNIELEEYDNFFPSKSLIC
jgi:hypothetical protein